MTSSEIVEEILHEAEALGIRVAVLTRANSIMQISSLIDTVTAYEEAFEIEKELKNKKEI